MRRPLIRHLSEGGASGDRSQRQLTKSGEDIRGSYGWDCRDYRHHLSTLDLLKVPNHSKGNNNKGNIKEKKNKHDVFDDSLEHPQPGNPGVPGIIRGFALAHL
ncbi:hypothetical protein KQX54_007037 [Cotesia glomerata]|uniref:Uncharacterized protein n=1 Tax=Cotesia glomerata TaxID=32391 RepID=A0AAV7IZZ4_COTGL|nr:hypothetical protein KQX54_007037 [Cotesia glomerata]